MEAFLLSCLFREVGLWTGVFRINLMRLELQLPWRMFR